MSYLIVCVACLVTAALTLFSGFGLGTLLLPVFSLFFSVELAIAATAVVHLANNITKVLLVGRYADFRTTVRFALPAAFCAMFGAWLLGLVGTMAPIFSYQVMGREFLVVPTKLVIGILILSFAILELSPTVANKTFLPKYIPIGGVLSGFFGGLSGMQGALRSMFLMKSGLGKEQFVGTSVVSAVVVDVTRLSVYGTAVLGHQWTALSEGSVLPLVGVATGAAIVGSVVGTRLLKKTTLSAVQKTVGGLLILTGTLLVAGLI